MIPETIQRAQAGDENAFAEIYSAYKVMVHRVCLKFSRDEALSEDLTQDTFIAAFRHIGEFRGNAAFATWLHAVARNTTWMSLRKRRSRPVAESLEELREGGLDLPARDGQLENTPLRMALTEAIEALPPRQRAVLWLRGVEGSDNEEVAALLGVSVGCSKSQFHRAKAKLRRALLKRRPLH